MNLVLLLVMLSGSSAHAAFENTQLRYFSPLDLIHVMRQAFPTLPQQLENVNCRTVSPANGDLIGANSPAAGKPLQAAPGTSFLRWHFDCLKTVSLFHFQRMKLKDDRESLARFVPAAVRKKHGETVAAYDKLSWAELSVDERNEIVVHNLETLIGPAEVLQDLKSAQTMAQKTETIAAFVQAKASEPSVLEGVRWTIIAVMLQSEFLRY